MIINQFSLLFFNNYFQTELHTNKELDYLHNKANISIEVKSNYHN